MIRGLSGGDDDTVFCMDWIQSGSIFRQGPAGTKRPTVDLLPEIWPAVADRLIRAAAFIGIEQFSESDSDDRPFGVFLVPSAAGADGGIDLCMAIAGEVKARVTGSRMPDHALWIDGRKL